MRKASVAEPAVLRSQKFFGWRIVAASFTVLFVVYGIQFSFGVFVSEITESTDWSASSLQLLIAIYVFSYSALSMLSGWLTDEIGPRKVVATGSVLLLTGYVMWAAAPSLWWVLIGLSLVAPIGMSASWVPCNATVAKWFEKRRGLATGISSSGGSAANILVPPLAALLVAEFGWRTALLSMALVGGAVMLASAYVMRSSPESVGQFPDGIASQELVEEPAPTQPEPALPFESSLALSSRSTPLAFNVVPVARPKTTPSKAVSLSSQPEITPAQAWRHPTYWKLYGMYAATFTVVFVPFLHGVQFAESLGASTQSAALVISAIGVGGLVGRLALGPTSDRFDRRRAAAGALLVETGAFAVMAASQDLTLLIFSAVAFGMAYGGGVAVMPALTADYFGRTYVGTIVGRIFATAGAMAAIGPYVAQLMFDWLGDYRWVFILCAAANALSVILAFSLPALNQPASLQPASAPYSR